MLPERYLERPHWDEVLGLATHAGPLGHTLVTGMHRAIAALARAGNAVVADHVLVEPAWVRDCAECLGDLPAYFIAVRCPLAVLEQRERDRRNRTLGQAKAQFACVHAHAQYDLEVDTALNAPLVCAQHIKAFLDSGAPPTAFKQLRTLFADTAPAQSAP
jgi:chloramphenicol 3-O phosphotransferase